MPAKKASDQVVHPFIQVVFVGAFVNAATILRISLLVNASSFLLTARE